MTKQSALGCLFMLVGLALLAVVCAPVVVAIRAHEKLPDLSFSLVLTGLGTLVFGALLVQPKATKQAMEDITVTVENSNLPMIGGHGRREEDHTASATTVTVSAPKGGRVTNPSLQGRVTRLDCAVHHGGTRPEQPTMIVMHCTEGGSARSSILYLNTTTDKQASYHYLIDRDGSILRMTAPDVVAWHAGDSAWPNPIAASTANPDKPNGGRSVNAEAIGIAWANNGEALTPEQIESALWLCATEMNQYGIPSSMVVGHYEVSPGRKTDPKPAMAMEDWRAQLVAYGAPYMFAFARRIPGIDLVIVLVVGTIAAALVATYHHGKRAGEIEVHKVALADSVTHERASIDSIVHRVDSSAAVVKHDVGKSTTGRAALRVELAETATHVEPTLLAHIEAQLTQDSTTIADAEGSMAASHEERGARIQLDTLEVHQVVLGPSDSGVSLIGVVEEAGKLAIVGVLIVETIRGIRWLAALLR